MNATHFRDWRKRLDLTQAQAAALLGRSRSWVQSAEANRRPIEHVVELACRYLEGTMPTWEEEED